MAGVLLLAGELQTVLVGCLDAQEDPEEAGLGHQLEKLGLLGQIH